MQRCFWQSPPWRPPPWGPSIPALTNWKTYLIDNSGNFVYQAPTFGKSGGNPGGYVSGNAGDANHRRYSVEAPSSFFGNLNGKTLTVDITINGTMTTTAGAGPAMVRLYVGSDSSDYFISAIQL